MMETQMASNPAQAHPIHVQMQGFATCDLVIRPRFGFRRIFDLAVYAAIALTAAACFSSFILAFGSVAFWTANHAPILAHVLATPMIWTHPTLRICWSHRLAALQICRAHKLTLNGYIVTSQ